MWSAGGVGRRFGVLEGIELIQHSKSIASEAPVIEFRKCRIPNAEFRMSNERELAQSRLAVTTFNERRKIFI